MQLYRGQCLDEFLPRPELTPHFSGVVGQVPRAVYLCEEKPRRADGLKPHFGSGVPTLNSAVVDVVGLAKANDSLAYQSVTTSEGSLKLPVERDRLQYLPTADTLDFLSHNQGTRLQPLPARYFSR
jgi:hypothetical protein